jgi:hypothetical protein
MTLRLRCLRCGNLADLDPLASDEWGLCPRCYHKRPGLVARGGQWSGHRVAAWNRRWNKHYERHPTFKALSAALDALESTPHGTLVEVGDGVA